jgi:gluconate kinase
MFIVIEGSDGSGKSSLTSAISRVIKDMYKGADLVEFHKGKPEELSRKWVLNEWTLSIADKNWYQNHAVADRWHWGEVTYAPIKRPTTCKDSYGLLGASGWRWTELFMASRGIAQFWLYQPLEVIQRRVEARGDDFIRVTELEAILELYYHASNRVHSLAGKLTPSPDSLEEIDDLAKSVVRDAQLVSARAAKLAQFPYYIGPPEPEVLLVGDRPGGKIPFTKMPFFPLEGNSGDFLLGSLPETFWRSCGIINSSEYIGASFRELYEALKRPRIIALGRLAEKALMHSGMYKNEYNVMPHPQYVRRFHSRDKIEYGQAIQRLSRQITGDDPWILR